MYTDEIYFGSIRVTLEQVPGKVDPFHDADWIKDSSESGLLISLNRGSRLAVPGNPTADIVVPAVPAIDFVKQQATASTDLSNISPFLRSPILKVPDDARTDASPHAVASGNRSALVKLDSKWYRLKGCGNLDQGFPIRTNDSVTTGDTWRDIRGCAFPHTAARELYMTAYLGKSLEDQGIVSCNTPLAMAFYDPPNQPLGPTIQPVCLVEGTLGDRRLGTHVLAGLELLLPLLLDVNMLSELGLKSHFSELRHAISMSATPSDPAALDLTNLVTTGELMTDYTLGTSRIGHDRDCLGFCWPTVPRDASVLSTLASPGKALPVLAPDGHHCPLQWTREGSKQMEESWRPAWLHTCAELKNLLEELSEQSHPSDAQPSMLCTTGAGSTSTVLAYIYSRCGYDSGRILRGMHDLRISWGTYQDAMCRRDLDEWHCNAHANNLVIIPEHSLAEGTSGSESLLSFLDLDMAFDEHSFVDFDSGRLGADQAAFDRVLWMEHVNLMEVLAGSDSSTGVPMTAKSEVSSQCSVVKAVRTALYDTLILAHQSGYRGDTPTAVMPFDPLLHRAAHCCIRLAIIVMADFCA